MMTMRIKRPLLAFVIGLAIFLGGGLYIASQSDAHGSHWTKCRQGGRWIRGHQGVNWYGPWFGSFGCSGSWELWEWYPLSDPVWK